jgi:hypothetical protein
MFYERNEEEAARKVLGFFPSLSGRMFGKFQFLAASRARRGNLSPIQKLAARQLEHQLEEGEIYFPNCVAQLLNESVSSRWTSPRNAL